MGLSCGPRKNGLFRCQGRFAFFKSSHSYCSRFGATLVAGPEQMKEESIMPVAAKKKAKKKAAKKATKKKAAKKKKK